MRHKAATYLFVCLLTVSCSRNTEPEAVFFVEDTDNPKPLLTEFVFDDFSALGNPPDADFHSLEFRLNRGDTVYIPMAQLRMGYNEVYQGGVNGALWIVQRGNGYGYFYSFLNEYQVVKMELIYAGGQRHQVLEGLENRERIPHYFGYNPIVEVRLGCVEYQ